jgi:tyrosine-protein kinase Etk/Wzc
MAHEDPNDQLAGRPISMLPTAGSDWHGSPVISGSLRQRDDSIDLTQLWGMVRDNARLVFTIAGVVFVLVMAHYLAARMTFKSAARLYLGELEGKAQVAGTNLDITSGNGSEVSSEIELLRSRSMVSRAILASGLNVTISPPGWRPPRSWRWLLSWRDPAMLDVSANQVVATETSLADNIVKRHEYRIQFISSTEYVVSTAQMPPVRGRLGEPLKTAELSLTLVAGRDGPKAGAKYELVVQPLEEVVEDTLDDLDVTVPKAGNPTEPVRVLTLSFRSGSRRAATEFLGHLLRGYLDARHAWKTEDASAAEHFVTEQLRAMQQSLDRTQEKLAAYRSENPVVLLAAEAESMVQQVGRFEEQRVQAALQAASLRNIKRAMKNPESPLEAHMFGEADDAVLQQLATTLTVAREKMSDVKGQYSVAAPEMKLQQAQLRDQVSAIRGYVDARLVRSEQNVSALSKVIQELESKLKTVPGAELRLSQISRESEVYSKMYSYLLERQQQAAITKASTVSKNRILDPPQVPLREDSPKLVLHLASAILGLLFGTVVVVFRGLFSGIFRRENDVRVTLGPVQVFARIPARVSKSRPKNGAAWPTPPLFDVMAAQADVGYAEAFRSLRTNLYRALPGEHGKVVLVTSPNPGDGKTTCALSLAAMLAADNRRVLVIDGDVRKPTHHTLLDVPQEPGLRDLVLRSAGRWKESVHTMCLSVGWFDSISAGVGASAEILSDGYFSRFLVNARSHYDFIVIDSGSYPSVSDPLVLAPMSDFVLSILRLGRTPRKLAEEHVSGMSMVARGCALIVNGVEVPATLSSVTSTPAHLSDAFRRM